MRFAGHEGRKTECSKEGGWECNGQSGAVTDPPWSMRAAGSWGCQSHIDAAFDQLCKPRPTTLPLFPGDGDRATVCGARRRLVFVPLVKLKPKNFRTCGAATALFALLTVSLRCLVRNSSMLVITRSPAR